MKTGDGTLTLCADDFGRSRAIDTSIVALAAHERITATSVMVTIPGWDSDVPALREHESHLDIGLHLDLTEGEAGTCSALWPQRRFPALWRWILCRPGTASTGILVARELNCQLDRFERAFGRRPDHIDGHQHVHVVSPVADVLMMVVSQRYGNDRPWIRLPTDRSMALLRRPAAAKAGLVAGLASRFESSLREAGLSHNKGFSGFSAFRPKSSFQAIFPRMLTGLGPRPLVMCHPAIGYAAKSRQAEHAYLAGEAFAALLDERSLCLIRMTTAIRQSKG